MSSHPPETKNEKFITIRIRRRSWLKWAGWLNWGVILIILLNFAVSNIRASEAQAAVISGVAFLMVLIGGLIVNYIRGLEAGEEG